MRLIDAKEIEKQVKEAFKENPVVMGMLLRWIRKQHTIDAVPVVRCKDCNRGKTAVEGDSVWCCCYQMEMELDNFCKNGGEADE